MTVRSSIAILCVIACASNIRAADWNQWRGPNRDGAAPDSPPLIEALPAAGLAPQWICDKQIPTASGGGWSSPIVAGGNVYLFTHKRFRSQQGELPPPKYPYLAPEDRGGMSDEEYEEYERNRRDEQEQRAKNFRFEETLYCIDTASGSVRWVNERQSAYTRFSQSGTPAISEGRIYVMGAGRTARCIDASTGADVWETALPGEFRDEFWQSSFAVVDSVAVVMCGWLFGLDADSGKILWQVDEGESRTVHTSPVVWTHGGENYVISHTAGGQTACVAPRSGEVLWRVKTDAGHSTPVVVGDRMITYGSSRKAGLRCYQLSREGAEHVWTYQRAADPGSSPVVVDGHVYVQGDKRLACVELETGKAAWSTTLSLNRPRYTSLVAADGKVVYAFDGVICFAADGQEYRQLFGGKIDKAGLLAEEAAFRRLLDMDKLETTAEGQRQAERIWREQIGSGGPLPCSTPAIADGKLYIRLKNGLACYDLRTHAAVR